MTTVPEPLVDLGPALVHLRETLGLSRKELAEALGVTEADVARDEQCGYRGLPLARARRMLQLLAGLEKQATSVARFSSRGARPPGTPTGGGASPRRSAPPRRST